MTYYQQPVIPKPKRRAPLLVLIILSVFVALGCVGLFTGVSMHNDADARNSLAPIIVSTDTPSPTSGPAAKTSKAEVVRSWGDGTWAVPSEMKPGTYVTKAADHCYWERLKSFDGDFDSINANGNIDPGGRGRVTIKKTDKGFDSSGGCVWTREGA